jgi:hypothetical protein
VGDLRQMLGKSRMTYTARNPDKLRALALPA